MPLGILIPSLALISKNTLGLSVLIPTLPSYLILNTEVSKLDAENILLLLAICFMVTAEP